MTATLVPFAADAPLTVCRVRESAVVHLVRESGAAAPEREALCGGTVVAGRPAQLFLQSPCSSCVRAAHERGQRAVKDVSSAWVNLTRLAGQLRSAA